MKRMAIPARCRPALSALFRDQQGLAVVEFAFVVTFMVFLYLGSQQLADAVFANRKVTTTARAIADLTTQYSAVTEQDIQSVLGASAKVLTPYHADNARVRVSQIAIDEDGNGRISWSRARGAGIQELQRCAVIEVPTELSIPNSFLIYGEVEYTHRPVFAAYSVGTMNLSDQIFMLPRVSSSVSFLGAEQTDCSIDETA